MKKLTLSIAAIISFIGAIAQPNMHYMLVGTYTSERSEGIYVYRFNSETGDFDSVSMVKTPNPSYLAVSPDKKFVYAVHEEAQGGNGGEIVSFSFDKTNGKLTWVNKQLSGGDHPCYVAVDKTGKWVVAGNYTSGSLTVIPVTKEGFLNLPQPAIKHIGSSVNSDRQKGPHVHATVFSPDNNFLFVPDLGIDKVMTYSFNEKTGKLTEVDPTITEPGAGPRHFDFHPNKKFAYLIEELTGGISAYSYSKGKLTLLQNISALPPEYNGPIGSADIHVSPDGKFLYVSNRGESNTIGIFKIDNKTGTLMLVGHQSTLGRTPRNFNFDPSGKFLLVANQSSNSIIVFKRDMETGLLSETGKKIRIWNPVCIKWIE